MGFSARSQEVPWEAPSTHEVLPLIRAEARGLEHVAGAGDDAGGSANLYKTTRK